MVASRGFDRSLLDFYAQEIFTFRKDFHTQGKFLRSGGFYTQGLRARALRAPQRQRAHVCTPEPQI